MMRLPSFRYLAARTVAEAVDLLAEDPGSALPLAGGTDLLPNMKRRQQTPSTLVGLRQIQEMRQITQDNGLALGAGVTLSELVANDSVRGSATALWQAAAQVATPLLRNMGTLGGNLCLDTRCNYYDQNFEWRKAIGFCMKKDGETCWVAPSSSRCLAVSSTDTAPALVALDAIITLAGAEGTRRVRVSDLYRNDGIHHLTRRPTEIVTTIEVPASDGCRSTYWKLRRRGSFDFPVMSVAAAARFARDGTVEAARIVLGAIASSPLEVPDAAAALVGTTLSDDAIHRSAHLAAHIGRPLDNTDFSLTWRKKVIRDFAEYALRELRGDDVRELRRGVARTAAWPAEMQTRRHEEQLNSHWRSGDRLARFRAGSHGRLR
jgi:4-hydroxybenzoyl-CoA reductase subunit beta